MLLFHDNNTYIPMCNRRVFWSYSPTSLQQFKTCRSNPLMKVAPCSSWEYFLPRLGAEKVIICALYQQSPSATPQIPRGPCKSPTSKATNSVRMSFKHNLMHTTPLATRAALNQLPGSQGKMLSLLTSIRTKSFFKIEAQVSMSHRRQSFHTCASICPPIQQQNRHRKRLCPGSPFEFTCIWFFTYDVILLEEVLLLLLV